jgi:hypothetical protein
MKKHKIMSSILRTSANRISRKFVLRVVGGQRSPSSPLEGAYLPFHSTLSRTSCAFGRNASNLSAGATTSVTTVSPPTSTMIFPNTRGKDARGFMA